MTSQCDGNEHRVGGVATSQNRDGGHRSVIPQCGGRAMISECSGGCGGHRSVMPLYSAIT